MHETLRLILRHPVFSDWEAMWRNVWQHPETARYMLWDVTTTEEAARERMERSIRYQENKPCWFVYEKESGAPIGFAGMYQSGDGAYEDTGIALGPDYVGKGYGKELLNKLTKIAKADYSAQRFIVSCRSENHASRHMILGCGFCFTHQENRIDPRNGQPYVLEFYEKML